MPEFCTVRAAIKRVPGLSEHYLRQLIKTGQCAGFYSGSRFYVNFPALLEQLDSAGRKEEAVNE